MIVILVLILIVIGINLFIVWLRINERRKISANSEAFKLHNENAKIKVLVVGDSSAVGTGADSSNDSLAGRFFKDYPNSDISNLAINGLRTEKLILILEEQKRKYDLVIIQIGANDIVRFVDIKSLSNSISRVLLLAKKLGKKVVLLTSENMGSAPFFPKPLGYFYTKKRLK